MNRFVGTVILHEGCLSLQTAPNVYYPLAGNSGYAVDFADAFGPAMPHDIDKRVYYVRGVMQMENSTQRDERLAKEA